MKHFELGRGGTAGYPFDVTLNMEAQDDRFICLGEGSGFASSGGSFVLQNLLESKWDEHLKMTKTLWLRELAESERDGLVEWNAETLREFATKRDNLQPHRQKRAALLVSVASEFHRAGRPHATSVLFVEAATCEATGVRWELLDNLLTDAELEHEPPSESSLSRLRDLVWADRALEIALDAKPNLAMGAVMALEGIRRMGPLRVLCDAIRGRWDDGSARSALKRLGTYGDLPIIRETLAYRFANDPDPLRPYLDFAAQAIDKAWAISIGSEPFDV